MKRFLLGAPLLSAIITSSSCGGRPAAPPPVIAVETPADEILRIGQRWTATTQQRGLLSPPSPISVFVVQEVSEVTLAVDSAREELVVEEELEMRAGGTLTCRTTFQFDLDIKWGRREGEAAVELRRPPLRGTRSCAGGQHPEPELARAGGPVRFVLRSDNLVAVEPPLEDRVYLPLP